MSRDNFFKKFILLLLGTFFIMFAQALVSYLFFYELIVFYSNFSKYLRYLFIDTFLIGLICFSFARSLRAASLCYCVLVFGLFLLMMLTRKVEGIFLLPYQGIENKILLLGWGAYCVGSVFFLTKSKIGVKQVLILSCVLAFGAFSNFKAKDLTVDEAYFSRGLSGGGAKAVIKINDSEYVSLIKQRNSVVDSGQKILFMHFPKTGGLNIREYLSKFYPAFSAGLAFSVPSKILVDTHTPRFNLQQLGLLTSRKFTFFRDPKKRVISEYRYLKATPTESWYSHIKDLTFLEYLKEKEESIEGASGHVRDNVYVRNLVDRPWGNYQITERDTKEAVKFLEQFEFIGFMDNYDKDFEELCDFLYVPKPSGVPISNVTNSKEKITITPEIERELDRLTKYDYIVYEAAKEVSVRKRKECKRYGNGVCRMKIK